MCTIAEHEAEFGRIRETYDKIGQRYYEIIDTISWQSKPQNNKVI